MRQEMHSVYFMISAWAYYCSQKTLQYCFLYHKYKIILMHFHCCSSENEVTFTINGKKYTGNFSFSVTN